MSLRPVKKLIRSKPTIEGAGVHLRRAFGFGNTKDFDPFLLLDDFRNDVPADYLAGFPWHPHRGIETITYVLSGSVEHGDSMGNHGSIAAGDVQWMTAGSGIIHQEMPKGDQAGRMHGFQLWANLPSSLKMTAPTRPAAEPSNGNSSFQGAGFKFFPSLTAHNTKNLQIPAKQPLQGKISSFPTRCIQRTYLLFDKKQKVCIIVHSRLGQGSVFGLSPDKPMRPRRLSLFDHPASIRSGHQPKCGRVLSFRLSPVTNHQPLSEHPIRMRVMSERSKDLDPALSRVFATHPGNRLQTPLFATLPKTASRKSFACHTYKPPRGEGLCLELLRVNCKRLTVRSREGSCLSTDHGSRTTGSRSGVLQWPHWKPPMSETVLPGEDAVLEVVSPDGARRYVRVAQTPFLIGRGAETGNHLQLSDRRISRNCAAIVIEANRFYIEDRGQRRGLFINGEKVESRELHNGDVITFGLEDSYEILFRLSSAVDEESIPHLLTRIEHITSSEPAGGLRKLNDLLAATAMLHSQLPLDEVLAHMLDYAVSITDADRGLLLEPDAAGAMKVRLARRSGKLRLPPESLTPSQTAIQLALKQQSPVITEDLAQAEMDLQAAQSIVAQRLRAVVVIPLWTLTRANTQESMVNIKRGELLGVLYLDSRRPTAFSQLDRQILDALAADAASTLDNARLVEKERERQRLEQEISIARDIQQALLPRNFPSTPEFSVTGVNFPCLSVGGDYFDVFPLSDGRTAFVIADVSGKGLGAAIVTTMLQGALSGMTLGTDPARVFNHVNRFLCSHTEVGRYATVFFGLLDNDGHLEFINAGHPSPFLIRRGAAEEAFTEGSFPVGLVPEAQYTAACLKLEPGDTLVLFTDGVTEAMDPNDELFGVPRLKKVLTGQVECPLEHLQKCVLEAVENFTRGARQADDLTLLIVRYRATAASAKTDTEVPASVSDSSSSAAASGSSARA